MPDLEMIETNGDLFASSVAAKIREHLPSDGVFVDVGGHGGHYTLVAARRTRLDGRVVVVEPVASNAAIIRRALRRNGFGNVAIFEQAASDVTGSSTLALEPPDATTGLVHASVGPATMSLETERRVAAIALDDLAIDEGLDRLDVLVIDSDGHEFEILEGAAMVLRTLRPVVMITVVPGDEREAIELLATSGYETDRIAQRTEQVLLLGRASPA